MMNILTQMGHKLTQIQVRYVLAVVLIIVTALLGLGLVEYRKLESQRDQILTRLYSADQETANLIQDNRTQREIIDDFQGQIKDIGSVVSDLDKLSKTDKELLQKYSKVYFLNENYFPSKLTNIDPQYLYQEERELQFHADAWPYLEELIKDAKDDDQELLIASAFRSYGVQADLKAGYAVQYGSGANTFSADQGYSEHQLGTTVDFTTPTVGAVFNNFQNDPAYEWLLDNAYKYGFVLSYPEGNGYYKFEPWHWRFVGKSLARSLHRNEQNFYDLTQRQIDPYLIDIFD